MHVVKRAQPYQLIFPGLILQVNLTCFALFRCIYPLKFVLSLSWCNGDAPISTSQTCTVYTFTVTNICSNASVVLLGEEKGEVLSSASEVPRRLCFSLTEIIYSIGRSYKLNSPPKIRRGPQTGVSPCSPEPKLKEKKKRPLHSYSLCDSFC